MGARVGERFRGHARRDQAEDVHEEEAADVEQVLDQADEPLGSLGRRAEAHVRGEHVERPVGEVAHRDPGAAAGLDQPPLGQAAEGFPQGRAARAEHAREVALGWQAGAARVLPRHDVAEEGVEDRERRRWARGAYVVLTNW